MAQDMLVGLPWPETEERLRAAGIPYTTAVTAPPRRPHGTGEVRVVGERTVPDGRHLIIAYRDYAS